jgi:hypothetical protein
MRMSKLWMVVLLAACSTEVETSTEGRALEAASAQSATTTTRIKVNGQFATMTLVDNAAFANGFLTASKDQVANTSALDFAYAIFDEATNPDLVILIAGAGTIPNSALTVTSSSALLQVTTPFEVTRCEVDLPTNTFVCAPTNPRSFNLTWAVNGFAVVTERSKRTEVLGPITTKSSGDFELRSARVTGTWDGHSTTDGNGNLEDTKGTTVIREIVMQQ